MVQKGTKYKPHRRLAKGPGECYMSRERDFRDSSCTSPDCYCDGYDHPLINFATPEEYLNDYLAMPDCPFVLEKQDTGSTIFVNGPKRIDCTKTSRPEPILQTICEKCELHSNGTCAFFQDFQTGYTLQVTAEQERFGENDPVDTNIPPMTVKDVRFCHHVASLLIQRIGYIKSVKGKHKRQQLELFSGIRTKHGGHFSIRLNKAILTHCADGLPRAFIAEGYGLSPTTVKRFEKELSDTTQAKVLENVKDALIDGTLLTQNDLSGTPYLHLSAVIIFGKDYYVLYKYTPCTPKQNNLTENEWKKSAEVVGIFAKKDLDDLANKWNALFDQDISHSDTIRAFSRFSNKDLLEFSLIHLLLGRHQTPAELICSACQVIVELAKRLVKEPNNSAYRASWDAVIAQGNPLLLAHTSVEKSLLNLHNFVSQVHANCISSENQTLYCISSENQTLSGRVTALRRLTARYMAMDLHQLWCTMIGESSTCRDALAEINQYAPYAEHIEQQILHSLKQYKRELESGFSAREAVNKVVYANRAVIPTKWHTDGSSTLPFLPNGDLDTSHITATGIRIHCLERLLKRGCLRQNKTTPLSCVTEKKNKKHPCYGCSFCPQVFPLEESQ